MQTNIAKGMASFPFRLIMLVVGTGTLICSLLMLLVVAVNLPDSWVGLIYVTLGLAAGISSIAYYFLKKPLLLIPILIMLAVASIIFVIYPPK